MGDGSRKPISQVKVGDKILATDPETGERGPRAVTRLWVHADTLLELEVDGGVLTTTEDHPFWNATDREYQRADQLDAGDQLLTVHGQLVRVIGLRSGSQRVASAYNLTVDDIHTYYVLAGETPVLVHNSDGCTNWSANSVKTWGHTFNTHGAGARNTKALTDRARSTGNQQGQWLDNAAAANFLKGLHVEGAGPRSVRIPDGLGPVIMPDGSIVQARAATIVPSPNGLYKTGFPIIGPN